MEQHHKKKKKKKKIVFVFTWLIKFPPGSCVSIIYQLGNKKLKDCFHWKLTHYITLWLHQPVYQAPTII
jgi:hypothetical protein